MSQLIALSHHIGVSGVVFCLLEYGWRWTLLYAHEVCLPVK